jgi:uncharacterized protein YcbK (DUF882 family)
MLNRRQFLAAATAIPSICTAQSQFSSTPDFWNLPRELWLHRASTGETVKATYWFDGKIHIPGYDEICWILRDTKTQQAVQMSITMLDVLRGMQGWLSTFGVDRPLITNSGYRSLSTNAHTEGAAHNSLHTQGRAWDGSIEGVSLESVARFGAYLAGGGVGFYLQKSFVHLDDGRRRLWRG